MTVAFDSALGNIAGRIAELIAEGDGCWRTCTGCYEGEDGQNVLGYPHSATFGCTLGGGCRECGGIGAVWDTTNYDEMAREMLNEEKNLAQQCTAIADTVIPDYRAGKRYYSCTGYIAKKWQAAWDGAFIALGGHPEDCRQ